MNSGNGWQHEVEAELQRALLLHPLVDKTPVVARTQPTTQQRVVYSGKPNQQESPLCRH